MNEDKEMVPVSQLREAEARAERAEALLNSIYDIVIHARTMLENAHAVERIETMIAAHDAGKDER